MATQAHTSHKVGLLGGGQLARMMAEAAQSLKIEVRVLTGQGDDPAARLAPAVLGSIEEPRVVRDLFAKVDTITFENEFVDTRFLRQMGCEFPSLVFHPSLSVLERLQDKWTQKELLLRLGIPTAKARMVTEGDTIAELNKSFPKGAVLKWSRMGYDGKGLLFFDGKTAQEALNKFQVAAANKGGLVYAEEKVPFKRELAIVACRSASGQTAAYPLVQSEQDRGICSLVTGPATKLGNTTEQEKLAVGYAKRLAEALDYVGVIALELFETQAGEILVNEIAPRVHNSGHFSQEACPASQFENHLRAVTGMPLGDTKAPKLFAMLNILGPEDCALPSAGAPLPKAPAGARLHWYEKKEIRSRRKMGHFNATATGPEELDKMVRSLKAALAEWTAKVGESRSGKR